ncbi:uncharacterized protein G2W53_006829 [Senna tora]|uniref:Uncharacterized protein n=1 Tax=Senna tora TaxID=362788 RepID=A0A834X5W0_9FABA|nr:uncharacterized protein G2W53_006829 [Senna tora]
MPGPGPHMMYAMGSGLALTAVSNGRFSPHHTLTYALNAFFGPDIGSFSEWLASLVGGLPDDSVGSRLPDLIHHPLYYILILGAPLCFLYSRISAFLLRNQLLDSVFKVPLSRKQCFLLISAGSFTHFFLDHLFEENGHSTTYTWILSTGWWEGRAPINPDAVVVIGFLCTCLFGGFFYINRSYRVTPPNYVKKKSHRSLLLVLFIATLYCLWCASQIYLINPRRPAVGEEADLGVILFLAVYLFLPHGLCIMSMHPKDLHTDQLPL